MKYIIPLILLITSQSVFANKCVTLVNEKDFYAAVNICTELANKNDAKAQFALATLYYDGNGVMEDNTQARKWFLKAAQNNHNQAQYNLAIMLASGLGGEINLPEALAWLKISKNNGYSVAAEAIKQMTAELSSSEKEQADKKMAEIKKEFNI